MLKKSSIIVVSFVVIVSLATSCEYGITVENKLDQETAVIVYGIGKASVDSLGYIASIPEEDVGFARLAKTKKEFDAMLDKYDSIQVVSVDNSVAWSVSLNKLKDKGYVIELQK